MRSVFIRPNYNAPTETGAGAAAGAPAGDGTVDTGTGGPSAAEILAFDPFGPPSSDSGEKPGDEGAAKTPPAEAKPDAGAKPGDTASKAPPADGKPATPEVPPQAPNLEQLFQQQTDVIRQAMEKAAPAAAPVKAEPKAPRFNLAIPPQIIDGMRSEDPKEFATAMHSVINGIANHLWDQFNAHLEQEVQPRYKSMIEEHYNGLQTQATVAQDFYGKHANLKDPMFQPLLQQAGMLVAQERMAAGKSVTWSEELRDEIAEKIYAKFPALRPTAESKGKKEEGDQKPKPRFNAGGGARPAVPSGQSEDFGADLLR